MYNQNQYNYLQPPQDLSRQNAQARMQMSNLSHASGMHGGRSKGKKKKGKKVLTERNSEHVQLPKLNNTYL